MVLGLDEWSWRRGLNPRPSDYKSDALPTELRQHCLTFYQASGIRYTQSYVLRLRADPFDVDGEAEARAGVFVRIGQVGEWLKPTDCKSVRPCGVRRFESFPVHQF